MSTKSFLLVLIFLLTIANPSFAAIKFQEIRITNLDSHKYPIYNDVLDYKKEAKESSDSIYSIDLDINGKHRINFGDQLQSQEIAAIQKNKFVQLEIQDGSKELYKLKILESIVKDLYLINKNIKKIPSGFALAQVRDVILVGSAKQIEKNNIYVVLSKSSNNSVQYLLAQFKSGKNARDFLTKLSLKKGDTVHIKEDLLSPDIDFLVDSDSYISAATRVSAVNNSSNQISDVELKDSIVQAMMFNSIFQKR
jgi:hypothetical protein